MKSLRVKKDAGYYLRVWRAERDLTQAEAAAHFKITPSHWSLLESGARYPSRTLAKRIVRETGMRLEIALGLS